MADNGDLGLCPPHVAVGHEDQGLMKNIRLRFPFISRAATGHFGLPGLRWALCMAACFAVLALGAAALHAQAVKSASEPPRTLSFRLALKRLEPASVTVPAGRYQIRLVNGLVVNAAVPFRLDRNGGAMLAQAQVAKGATSAKSEVMLTPGKYILEAGGRPEWRSEIVVTPPKS
jgi:hypothetical protein